MSMSMLYRQSQGREPGKSRPTLQTYVFISRHVYLLIFLELIRRPRSLVYLNPKRCETTWAYNKRIPGLKVLLPSLGSTSAPNYTAWRQRLVWGKQLSIVITRSPRSILEHTIGGLETQRATEHTTAYIDINNYVCLKRFEETDCLVRMKCHTLRSLAIETAARIFMAIGWTLVAHKIARNPSVRTDSMSI